MILASSGVFVVLLLLPACFITNFSFVSVCLVLPLTKYTTVKNTVKYNKNLCVENIIFKDVNADKHKLLLNVKLGTKI